MAVRLAIGAGRGSLIRQLLIENFLIAIGGGAAGLGIAYAAVRFFSSIPLPSDVPFKFSAQLDGRVMLFTACASIVSTFVFGLAPALISTRQDLVSVLKATDAATLKTGKPWGRNILVAGQMSLSWYFWLCPLFWCKDSAPT